MLRENIDNILNPPVVRYCCVLSNCILSLACIFVFYTNIDKLGGFLRANFCIH